MYPIQSRTDAAVERFDWLSVTFLLGAVLLCYYLVPLPSLIISQPPGVVFRLVTAPDVISAAMTSLTASVMSATIATIFGLPLAYWLARADGRQKALVTAIVMLPLVLFPIIS